MIPLPDDIRLWGFVGRLTATADGYSVKWILAAALLSAIAAYFLGSLNSAIIISKVRFKEDIRDQGSGNAGLTNMLRTYGKVPALLTLSGDMLKAIIAVYIGLLAAGEIGGYAAAFACVIGHCFPVYYHYKGGKGVLVAATSILCLEPLVFLFVIAIFIILVATLKYVSLGSIVAAFIYPLFLAKIYPAIHGIPLSIFPLLMSILISLTIIIKHHGNIKRLREGTESKFSIGKKDKKEKNEKKN